MKRWIWLGYCVPWAYLALWGDAAHGTVWLYALMAAAFFLLCRGSDLRGVLLGNLLSLMASGLCLWAFGPADATGYFKPLTAWSLMLVVSAVAAAVQAIYVCRRKKNQ